MWLAWRDSSSDKNFPNFVSPIKYALGALSSMSATCFPWSSPMVVWRSFLNLWKDFLGIFCSSRFISWSCFRIAHQILSNYCIVTPKVEAKPSSVSLSNSIMDSKSIEKWEVTKETPLLESAFFAWRWTRTSFPWDFFFQILVWFLVDNQWSCDVYFSVWGYARYGEN